MKHLTIILALVAIVAAGCDTTTEKPSRFYKYDVKVCNSVGCDHYDADSVVRNNDTYQLYIDGQKTTEIKGKIVVVQKQ